MYILNVYMYCNVNNVTSKNRVQITQQPEVHNLFIVNGMGMGICRFLSANSFGWSNDTLTYGTTILNVNIIKTVYIDTTVPDYHLP